jgi:hypothetical protein
LTNEVRVVGQAGLEDSWKRIVGVIVGAANAVVDVFTVSSSVGSCRITSPEAESITAHEVVPLHNLNVRTGPRVRVHDTTHGVTTEVSTVRVHFTSPVHRILGHVNVGLVNETNNLDVVGSFHKLETGNGSRRN